MAEQRYYAVYNAHEWSRIYLTWEEARRNVVGVSGAKHKCFRSLVEAEAWLQGLADAMRTDFAPVGYFDGPPGPWQPGEVSLTTPIDDPQTLTSYDYNKFGTNDTNYTDASGSSDMEILSLPYEPDEASILDASLHREQQTPSCSSPSMTVPSQLVPLPPLPLPNDSITGDPSIELSQEQKYVLFKVRRGESVFFTGSAGTGKSVLLREIIKYCSRGRQDHEKMKLAVTASTGIAAVNIGGCTLHSWAGIGLGKEDKHRLVGKLYGLARNEWNNPEEVEQLVRKHEKRRESRVLDRWRTVETLIIDEISMIDGKLFDKLEYIARQLRKNGRAFGGIQLVLSGDFCQLPPVPDKDGKGAQIPSCFAFEAESWYRCVGKPIILKKVFRQKDQKFVDMLNMMRYGRMDDPTTIAFRRLSRPVQYDDGIQPTRLYPTRAEVDTANSDRLATLNSARITYRAVDTPGRDRDGHQYPPGRFERALKDLVAPEVLPLKIGAQVMLVKNLIQGLLVNGTVGCIVAFYTPREAVEKHVEIGILPIIRHLNPSSEVTKELKEVREVKIKKLVEDSTPRVWPAVKFQSGPLMLCVPLTFEVVNADSLIEAYRVQVPLILAWALTIHKSQGQTLERVRVDMSNIFECGQAYVALSRATRLETLEVYNYDPSKVRAHPRVIEWMEQHQNTRLDTQWDYVDDAQWDDVDDDVDDVDRILDIWGDVVDVLY